MEDSNSPPAEMQRFAFKRLALKVNNIIERFQKPPKHPDVERFTRKRLYDHGLGDLYEASKRYGSFAEEKAAKAQRGVNLTSVTDPELQIDLEYSPIKESRESRMMPFSDIPEDFSFPAVCVFQFAWDNRPVETPYGMLSHEFVGPDGNVYSFLKKFFIDAKGKAVKYLDITQITNEDNLFYTEEEKSELPNTSVQPKEEDSKHLPMDAEDIKELEALIEKADSGEFKPFERDQE